MEFNSFFNRKERRNVFPGEPVQRTYGQLVDSSTGEFYYGYNGDRPLDQEIQTSCGMSVADVVRMSEQLGRNLAYQQEGPDFDATNLPKTRAEWSERFNLIQSAFDSAPLAVREACGFKVEAFADMLAAYQSAKSSTTNTNSGGTSASSSGTSEGGENK